MPSLSLGLSLGKIVRPLLSYIKGGRVLDLTSNFLSSDTEVQDQSGEDNDATLYSGRPTSTDGVADKAIQADASAAGSADYYLTGKVRPTGTSCRVQINDTASGEDDIAGLTSGVWQDFTSATFSSQTPSNIVLGWSSNSGFLAVACDWSDVRLVNATTGATVARYQLNESADGDLDGYPALDSSGNGYHGSHTGCAGGTGETTILQTAGMDWNKDTTTYVGKTILVPESDSTAGEDALGNAIASPRPTADTWNFFGDGEYGAAKDADSLDLTTAFTIELWGNFYGRPNSGTPYLMGKQTSNGSTTAWVLEKNSAIVNPAAYRLYLGNLSTYNQYDDLPDSVAHLCITYSAGTVVQYVNGVAYAPQVPIGTIPSSLSANAADVQIGRREFTGDYWDDQISRPKIYSRALTADEVLENFNAQKGAFGL